MKSKTELMQLSKEDLVEIILKMQPQLAKMPELEAKLGQLRGEVAEQIAQQEIIEENEINTFRRLSQQCADQNIEIPNETRAGANVDQMGSLSNVVSRRDISFVGSLTTGSSQVQSVQGSSVSPQSFRIGSMAPAIQTMSASLTTSAYQRSGSQAIPLLLGSFSTSGASQQRGNFNVVSQTPESKTGKAKQRINIVKEQAAPAEDDDDVNIVL